MSAPTSITLAGLLQSYAKQGGATVNGSQLTNGIITDSYLPAVADTSNSWIALFKKIHDQYDAEGALRRQHVLRQAVAYTFVQAMLNAGRNPTRADLVSAVNAGLPQGPMVAPFAYSATNHDGCHRRLHGRHAQRRPGTGGIGADHGHERDGPDHYLHGIRGAGTGEWHPVRLFLLLRPHRPSRTGRSRDQPR